MSKLFRTEKWLTIDQLIRAWSPELARGERDPNQYEQDLKRILLQDIVNSRLDDSGPLREGRQLQQVILNLVMNAIESMNSAEPRILSIKNGNGWTERRTCIGRGYRQRN